MHLKFFILNYLKGEKYKINSNLSRNFRTKRHICIPSKPLGHNSQVLSLCLKMSQFHFKVSFTCYWLVLFLLITIVLLILLEIIYCLGYFIFPSVIPKVLPLVCFQNGFLKQVYKMFQQSTESFSGYVVLSLHSPHSCSFAVCDLQIC